jgi:signal transduction histidine kinase
MIEKLKEYAQLDRGNLDRRVDLPQVVESAIKKTRELIDGSTDKFSVHIEENLPWVEGNFRQIEELLVNLLTNACQALTDRNQGITIGVLKDDSAQQVVVLIGDQGIGIPTERSGQITEPFYTTRRAIGATGLGLPNAKEMIEKKVSLIEYLSESGKLKLVG